jgi:hypothetical protein
MLLQAFRNKQTRYALGWGRQSLLLNCFEALSIGSNQTADAIFTLTP